MSTKYHEVRLRFTTEEWDAMDKLRKLGLRRTMTDWVDSLVRQQILNQPDWIERTRINEPENK